MKINNTHFLKATAIFVIAVGLLVLAGWQTDSIILKKVFPLTVAMNPMAAVAFLFSGCSFLLLLQQNKSIKQRRVAMLLAMLIILIATLRIAATFNLFDAGIDRLLFTEKIAATIYNGKPSFITINTAVAFLLIGIALLCMVWERVKTLQWFVLPVTAIGLLSVIGYSYHISSFYSETSFVPMSMHSGICFFVLSIAMLFANSNKGYMAEVTHLHAGGKAARLLLPAALLVPSVLGYFVLNGVLHERFSIAVWMSLFVTAIILLFGFLVWIAAYSINKFETERQKEKKITEEKLKQFNQELEKQVHAQTQLIIEKEQQYRFLLENMQEGVQLLGFDWRYIFVNNSFIKQSRRLGEEEFVGAIFTEKFPGIEKTELYATLQTCMQERVAAQLENEYEFPDGKKEWFQLSIQPVPEGLFILSKDITAQKKTEQQIRETQERYYTLMNSVEGIVWEADAQTLAFSFVSQQAERLLGYPVERWINEPDFWANHIYEDDRTWAINYCTKSTSEGRSHQFEYRMLAADGRIVWLRDIVAVTMENKVPVRLSGIMVDITETKKMEAELSKKMLSQQKLTTEITILAQEKERNELGLELHDNINQLLSVVKLYLGIAKNEETYNREIIEKCFNHLEEAMTEIRTLSHSLVTPTLGNDGLRDALQDLVDSVPQTNHIRIALCVDEQYDSLEVDKNKELMIYRIVQEQLSNIIKYAKASDVSIVLIPQQESLYLSVSDNGVGFDMQQTAGKGIGLKNINNRVEYYAGEMKITAAPGKGCTLEVFIPH